MPEIKPANYDDRLEKVAREVLVQVQMLYEDLDRVPQDTEALRARLAAIQEYVTRGIDLLPAPLARPVSSKPRLQAANGHAKPLRAPVQ